MRTTARSRRFRSTAGITLAGGVAASIVALARSAPANAAASHFNTNPYTTGCASNSYTICVPRGSGRHRIHQGLPELRHELARVSRDQADHDQGRQGLPHEPVDQH